jgi:hypothetical protein
MTCLTSTERVKLFLNRETLTPFETALVESLNYQLSGLIQADIGYDLPEDQPVPTDIEYALLTLIVMQFREITAGTIGVSEMGFQNLSMKYDHALPPSLDRILQRYRAYPVV